MAQAVMAGAAVLSAAATGYSVYTQHKAQEKRQERMEEQQELAEERLKMRRQRMENRQEYLEERSRELSKQKKQTRQSIKKEKEKAQEPSRKRDMLRAKAGQNRSGTLLTDPAEEEEAPTQKKTLLGG